MSGNRFNRLSSGERQMLLALARDSVVARVTGEPPPGTGRLDGPLLERRGVFVTLRIAVALRGCIGVIDPDGSLAAMVVRCAAGAASDDPRFPPMSREEIDRLTIEISALHPPLEIDGPERLVLGRHGIIVTQGRRQGLLLPQVAIEQGWDQLTFVQQTCRKAGLDVDAWKRGARLQAFEAEIFSEAPPY